MMRIGYFADGPWGHNAFKKIIEDKSLETVFLMVRYDSQDSVLIELAREYNIPLLLHPNVNSDEFLEMVAKFDADLFVSMSFNQIFRRRFIELPKYGTINCHAGKLPFYRGRNILNWALINDETEFGITVHYVDEGIDTGDIILQKTYPITDDDDYGTLLEVAYTECADILYDAIKLIQNGDVKRISQSSISEVGLYCGMRRQGDEVLNWNQTSRDIFNFVRAVTLPGPCARTDVNGEECIIEKVSLISNCPIYKGIPGQVLKKEKGVLFVKTLDSYIVVEKYKCNKNIKVGDRFTCRMF